MIKKLHDGKEDTSFGVGIPQFFVNCEWSTKIERTSEGNIKPRVATVNGQQLLIRIGIGNEDEAGKLFAHCHRILYGSDAVSDILSSFNSTPKQDGLNNSH